MEKDMLMKSLVRTVLAICAVFIQDEFVLINGQKFGRKHIKRAYRDLVRSASHFGIIEHFHIKDDSVIDEAIEYLYKNDNATGAMMLEEFKQNGSNRL